MAQSAPDARGKMMVLAIGLAMIAVGAFLLFVARPRGGELVPFLRPRYFEVTYSFVVTTFLGLGIAATLGGAVSLLS